MDLSRLNPGASVFLRMIPSISREAGAAPPVSSADALYSESANTLPPFAAAATLRSAA